VIYGRVEEEVFYVGRTIQAVTRRSPVVIGLHQRLRNHRKKYGRAIGTRFSIGFRFLVVPDPCQRTLLEALATGILCPVDLAYGYKRLSDLDPDDFDRLEQVLHDIRNMEKVDWSYIADDGTLDMKDDRYPAMGDKQGRIARYAGCCIARHSDQVPSRRRYTNGYREGHIPTHSVAWKKRMPNRRFPPPWSIDGQTESSIVKDANGHAYYAAPLLQSLRRAKPT
jgi:hypothetical protein